MKEARFAGFAAMGLALVFSGAASSQPRDAAVQTGNQTAPQPSAKPAPKSIGDLLAPAAAPTKTAPVRAATPVAANLREGDPVAALLSGGEERPAAASFEQRARTGLDLASIVLRPSDEALALKALDDSPTHGLHRSQFAAPDLGDRLRSSDAAVRASALRELKIGLLRYARAQHGQRVAPDSFLKEWGVRPEPYNPDKAFAAAIAEDRLGAWIEDLAPPSPGYQALRRALAVYRDIAQRGGWSPVPGKEKLQAGDHGARVLALRARLAVEDAQLAPAARPEVFDTALGEAVVRYQLRNGLNPTAVVDRLTLNALNQPVGQRITQIIANLERWRWLDRDMPATRIEVNIAAAGMTVYSENKPVLSMRAAPGRPTDETPMLTSRVESIVVNPPWNVPSSIAEKELWPKERKHPGYLAAHGFHVIQDANGGSRLQQEAGPSALGKLKFDFPNAYGVYLHDTPSHSTFSNDTRAVSHGCVRLQRPGDLATLLLQSNPTFNPEQFQTDIDSGDTKRVRLAQPMPVIILYWTAYVAGGQVSFRPDIYGWDQTLVSLIDPPKAAVPAARPD